MTALADWRHRLNEIPANGLRVTRKATPEERAEIAASLSIVSCENLSATYQIKAKNRDRYELTGHVTVGVIQSCIVSLEPVRASLDETLDCAFIPSDLLPESREDEQEVLSIDDLEPIENGWINVGRIVFEVISTGLDPYPRREDAQWSDVASAREIATGPFAALAELKKKS